MLCQCCQMHLELDFDSKLIERLIFQLRQLTQIQVKPSDLKLPSCFRRVPDNHRWKKPLLTRPVFFPFSNSELTYQGTHMKNIINNVRNVEIWQFLKSYTENVSLKITNGNWIHIHMIVLQNSVFHISGNYLCISFDGFLWEIEINSYETITFRFCNTENYIYNEIFQNFQNSNRLKLKFHSRSRNIYFNKIVLGIVMILI